MKTCENFLNQMHINIMEDEYTYLGRKKVN